MQAVADGILFRRIQRKSREMLKQGRYLTGRQSLRIVYQAFVTDLVSKNMFNTNHLHNLKWLGDEHMEEWLETWFTILEDQEIEVDVLLLERILFEKIEKSVALKPYLDKYNMAGKTDTQVRCYQYLIEAMEEHVERTRERKVTTAQAKAAQVQLGKADGHGEEDED